jgi:AraC family transcriptional regulator of adaptative response / DNA-3-methyladenine glycosylase II
MAAKLNHPTQDPDPAAGPWASLEGLMAQVVQAPGRFRTVAALAEALGLGIPALEGLFLTHAHLDAVTWLQAARIKAAGALLLSGPAGAVGEACGFSSPEAYETGFAQATGLAPAAYQALGRTAAFTLALPLGYRVEDMLAYHGRDPLSLSERVSGATLAKGVVLEGRGAMLEMAFQGAAVHCRVLAPSAPGARAMAQAHRRAVRMLGLGTDPAAFERSVAGLDLGRLVASRPGLRIPLTADVWESLVWAILGQQVNLAFAYSLRRQLTELCGGATDQGLRVHPTAAAVAELEPEQLKPLQFSRSKAEYVIGLARKVARGELPLEDLPDGAATAAAARLSAERGIGPWTAHYVLMRGCGFGDCVPLGDAGLTLALQRHHQLDHRPTVKETAALMAPFAPHRSLATFHLWASLKGVPA